MCGFTYKSAMGKNPAVVQGPATDMRVARSIGKAVKADRACKVLVLNFRGGREAHPFWNMLSVNLVKNQGDTIFHMVSPILDAYRAFAAVLSCNITAHLFA